ncbi:MAG: hypothetical protein N2259_02880 [Patescibacteria group bacterium]|nr:hypothetical protein [Patescibacteria group bacterium]
MPKKETLKSLGKGEYGEIWAQWSFPEKPQYQRKTGWWIFMVLLSLGLIIWAFKEHNFLFIMLVVIVALIVIFETKRSSLQVECQITQDGLKLGSSFYEWSKIKKFWLIFKPPEVKRLYFQLKTFPFQLSLPLEKQNPIKIRKILLKYVLEDLSKEDESLADFLSRSLKI